MFKRVVTAAFVGFLGACGTTPLPAAPTQQVPLSSSFASNSSSGSGYSSEDYRVGKGLSVPRRSRLTDPTRMRVRPDLYTVSFAVREQRETSHAAQDAARISSDRVVSQLLKTLGPAATANVKGFTLTRVTQEAKPIGVMAVVDGMLEVRLAENQDFWVRSRLFTTLIETTQAIAEAAGSAPDSMHAVSFEPPRAEVLDPEAYRPELLKRWVARVRDFTSAAEASAAPLYVRDCAPPGAVGQSASSFDEVLLELAITCRIDTRTATAAVSSPPTE